ncbi:MAG: hypothetical protein EXR50_05990 [Dehalococcoidia bacterium]|nr:hypothetical protein [Dehalococcoidia bacterium]
MKAEEPFYQGEVTSPLQDRQNLVTFCDQHPEVETALRCGKCGTPICPRCVVQTPVGGRCAKCANLKKLPIFEVHTKDYTKAVGFAVPTSLALGLIWALLPFGGYFSFIVSGGVGYALGEVVSVGANRKSSIWLKVVAGIAVVICYISASALPLFISLAGIHALTGLLVSNIMVSSIIGLLSNPFAWLTIGIGVFMAIGRLR